MKLLVLEVDLYKVDWDADKRNHLEAVGVVLEEGEIQSDLLPEVVGDRGLWDIARGEEPPAP